MEKFACLGLVETWSKDGDEINIDGYSSKVKHLKRRGTRGRHPGGIAMLCKDSEMYQFEEILIKLESALCIKVNLPGFELIVLVTYRHPCQSKYHNEHFFAELSEVLNEIEVKHPTAGILIMGDFNARIGEECVLHPHNNNNGHGHHSTRKSKDKIHNPEGRELLNLCCVHYLEILNGFFGRDIEGEITFIHSNGESVIDYILANENIIPMLSDFWVETRIDSHHMALCVSIKYRYQPVKTRTAPNGPKQIKFKWEDEKKDVYKANFSENLRRLHLDLRNKFEINNYNSAVESITKYLQKSGREMRKHFSKRNISTPPAWYINECRTAKPLATSALRKYRLLGGTLLRQKYVHLRKCYKNLLLETKKLWQESESKRIRQIVNKNNSRDIWTTIRRLRRKTNVMGSVEGWKWETHFSQLLSHSEELSGISLAPNVDVIGESTVDVLDAEITIREITDAIKDLRNNKAPGIDGVPTEFIKEVRDDLVPLLHTIFNNIFENGIYPDSWNTAVIQPIYKKKGNIHDPNN